MVSSVFWVVYATLIVLIAGAVALSLYAIQSALNKNFKAQDESLKKTLDEWRQEADKTLLAKVEEHLAARDAELLVLLQDEQKRTVYEAANKLAAFQEKKTQALIQDLRLMLEGGGFELDRVGSDARRAAMPGVSPLTQDPFEAEVRFDPDQPEQTVFPSLKAPQPEPRPSRTPDQASEDRAGQAKQSKNLSDIDYDAG